MKQPFFKDLYVCSSLANCSQLEEVEEPGTELMQVNISCPEDTYRVGKKTQEKCMQVILGLSLNTGSPRKIVHVFISKKYVCIFLGVMEIIFPSWFPDV